MDVFQVSVAVQSVLIVAEQVAGLLVSEPPFPHRQFHVAAQTRDQRIRLELHVVQHLANRVAFDHGVEHHFARFVQPDMDRVGIAEQIVQVAENLLIGAQQERAQVIVLAVKGVQRAAYASRRGDR